MAGIFFALINPVYSSPLPATNPPQVTPQILPSAPPGLKNYFMVGLANGPGDAAWMTLSLVPWDTRYQYLSGGVNTPGNWKTWQWDQLPPGQFALDYMNDSYSNGYLPILTWYQMLQSLPHDGSGESNQDYNNLNNPSTMNSYFSDFKLLLDKAKAYGKTVILHIEPDLWGYLKQLNSNPNNTTAAVASSGYGDVVANKPNTSAGFAQALVALRDKYAPNALLAFHISPWASTYGDVASDPRTNFNVAGAAQETANFYNLTGANFDLLFYDIADRDAGYYEVVRGDSSRWWDTTNTTFPDFNRFHQFVADVTAATGRRGMLWQVPLGNTVYKTMNNTGYHYQDNKAQYYMNSSNQHIQDAANSGLIGIMFGSGGDTATIYTDHKINNVAEGITNPAPINGNNQTSIYADDDGGYIRVNSAAYYSRGPVAFGNPKFASTPAPGLTIALSGPVGSVVSTTFSIRNTGSGGTGLNVSAPNLSGPNAGIFSVTPNTAFSIATGGAAVSVTVQCNPTGRGTFSAALGYTTNDSTQPQVSYPLSCSGLAPKFSSAPYASGATINLTGQVGQPISATLQVSNAGSPGTTLAVNSGNLTQGSPAVFTAAPLTAFSLSQGAAARAITITCTPQATGVNYTGTLTFPVTNDPDLANATYNLACKALTPMMVTAPDDNGPGLTLANALSTYTPGENIILFNVTGNQVDVSAATLPPVNRGAVVIDGGGCTGGQPAITITGPGKSLTLGPGVELRNIHFSGVKLIATGTGGGGSNKLGKCVVVTKS